MGETLLQRLGGAERIAAVIDDVIDRHAVNPVLAPRLRGKDLPTLKRLGTALFCAGIGGAHECGASGLRITDAAASISDQEFMSAIDDVVAALRERGTAAADVDEVVAVLCVLRSEAPRPRRPRA
jgi:hypothetical protein